MMIRKKPMPASGKIAIGFTERQRDLLENQTFVQDSYWRRLRPKEGHKKLFGAFTIDELEDMLGFLAAAANHAGTRRLQDDLDALSDKIEKTIERHGSAG
jgi:hypothetical protein